MILRISELKMRPDHTRKEFERELRKILQKKDGPLEYEIMRRSIDARKKPDLFYVYTVDVKVEENAGLLKKIKTKKVAVVNPLEYQFPYNSQRQKTKNSLRLLLSVAGRPVFSVHLCSQEADFARFFLSAANRLSSEWRR